jgi:hypothetical protein
MITETFWTAIYHPHADPVSDTGVPTGNLGTAYFSLIGMFWLI